jgi:macrolide transport system ATP-binding/permease protein
MCLSIQQISKSYGPHVILADVSLTLAHGQRVGLVGANGVGKSTLLKIVIGEIVPDGGSVTLMPGRTLGYIAQAIELASDETLQALIDRAQARLLALEVRMRALESRMADADGGDLLDLMAEYGDVTDAFERGGGYEMESRVDAVLGGLGVGGIERARSFATLSGGEKSRVGLALLLLESPDVLLLDEPANHLDFTALAWLEGYLRAYRGAVLIVSHDRQFLNNTVDAIIEIDEHTHEARRYTGSYDAYAQAKALERRRWEVDYAVQQEEIRTLRLEVAVTARRNDRFRAATDGDKFEVYKREQTHHATVARRVRSAEEKLSRILDNPIERPPEPLRFQAALDPRLFGGRFPVSVDGVSQAYDGRVILDDVSFSLAGGQRVVLVGPNGAGKSTLLKIIAGWLSPDAGGTSLHPAAVIGYLDQEDDGLPQTATLFEAFRAGLDTPDQQLKSQLITMGLFRYDEFDKPVRGLSKGQQHKLQIARLIAMHANVLILDEPTNFVSFDVLEGFEQALRGFEGVIIAASHDRRFIQQFADSGGDIWTIDGGRLVQSAPDSLALA